MVSTSKRLVLLSVATAALLVAACQPAPAQPVEPAPPPPAPAEKPAQPAAPKPAEPAAKPVQKPVEKPAEAKPEVRTGGTLNFGISRDLNSTNPFMDISSTGKYIKEGIWEPLIIVDLGGRLQPGLAESWEVGEDLQTFTFNLRRGVRFHDGQELTADDVIFSIQHAMNPENAAAGFARLALVDQLDKVDDYTLRIITNEPGYSLLAYISEIRAFSVVPAGSMQVGQLDVGQNPPPGTGPFKFVEYVPNQRVVVERFDDYWGGAPPLDRISYQVIPDATVRFTALRAGDMDVVERLPIEWLPRLDAGEVQGVQLHAAPDSGMRRLQFNQTSPIMSNKTLRQAIAYAIDRDAVVDEAFEGFGTPINMRVPPGSVWHTVAIPARERDLARSRELAEQAGYQGQEISMISRRGHENFAEPILRMLTEAGFNVRFEILESAVNEERTNRGQYDLTTGGGGFHTDPAVSLRSNYYCEPEAEVWIDNDVGYCNEEVDQIFDDMDRTGDEAERLALLERFAEITFDDVVNLYLGTEPRYFGSRDYVHDFNPTGEGQYFHADGGLKITWLDR